MTITLCRSCLVMEYKVRENMSSLKMIIIFREELVRTLLQETKAYINEFWFMYL